MEKYLITSWNTTTPSKRARETKKERERERRFKKTLDDTFSSRSSAKSEQWQRESTHGLKTCVMWFLMQLFYEQKERHFFSTSQARENEKDFSPFRKAEKGGKMARGGICIHTSRIYIDSSALQVLLLLLLLFIVVVGVVLVVLKQSVAQYAYMCIVLRSISRGAFILFLLKRSPLTRLG